MIEQLRETLSLQKFEPLDLELEDTCRMQARVFG
jgi:hypothetical protein